MGESTRRSVRGFRYTTKSRDVEPGLMHICRAGLCACAPAALAPPPPCTLRTRRLAALHFLFPGFTCPCSSECSLRGHCLRPRYACRSTSGRSRWVASGCWASRAHNALRFDMVPDLVGSGPPTIVLRCRCVQTAADAPICIETPQVQLETPPLIPSSSPSAPARAPLAMAAALRSNLTPFETAGGVSNSCRL